MSSSRTFLAGLAAAAAACSLFAGCGKPNPANIALRRQNAELRSQLEQLQRQHQADAATLRAMQSDSPTTAPVVSRDQAQQLFTVHGIRLGRLTGGSDLDPAQPGDDGLKVYVVPTDDQGQQLKAAGSFVVEAFDLAKPGEQRVGRWEFPLEEARKHWFGSALLYEYVLTCPWQQTPERSELTLRVTFTDALTGRSFTQQKVVQAKMPT